MEVYQRSIKGGEQFDNAELDFIPDLIILFISPEYSDEKNFVRNISLQYPTAIVTGCSTSGEIMNTTVDDASIVMNAIKFEKTELRLESVSISKNELTSFQAGVSLSQSLYNEDLRHVLIFSDGLNVNGAELVKGLVNELDDSISITGGLAGDGVDFNKTYTIRNGEIHEGEIVGLGFYGSALKIGYSSKGGWDSFGIERQVTRSKDNILYELDGKPALELYKSFLGDQAEDLPGSGLLFPLSIRMDESQQPVVRTILGVSEEDQSLTFAGNIPMGAYARLMKANIDHLINGAEDSAKLTRDIVDEEAEFALLISCVGRRLVLKQLVEEEVEAVREVLGDKPVMTGFYSYGELAPFGKFQPCQLHNQTMTITTFSEASSL